MERELQGIRNRNCCIRRNWIDRELGTWARRMAKLEERTVEARWVANRKALHKTEATVSGKMARKMASKLAAFGVINQAAGFVCFAYGSRLLPAMETALIGAFDAPLAPLWAFLLFAVMPVQATLIGGGIVFFAVMAHFWVQTRTMNVAKLDTISS